MRYPADHKQETRERILGAAAALFRRNGYAATGVDAVMASAKLTAGGFYSHFRSKGVLLAKALDAAFRESRQNRPERLKDLQGKAWIREFLAFYLSPGHRDAADHGCPMPALAPEIGRSDAATRAVFQEHLESLIRRVAKEIDISERDRERAIFAIATSVGGLMLSRAVKDEALSDEILEACRKTVVENCRD